MKQFRFPPPEKNYFQIFFIIIFILVILMSILEVAFVYPMKYKVLNSILTEGGFSGDSVAAQAFYGSVLANEFIFN